MFINVNLCWNWIEKFWTTRRNVIYQNLEEIGPIDSKSQSIEKYDCGKLEKRRKTGYDNSCSIKTPSICCQGLINYLRLKVLRACPMKQWRWLVTASGSQRPLEQMRTWVVDFARENHNNLFIDYYDSAWIFTKCQILHLLELVGMPALELVTLIASSGTLWGPSNGKMKRCSIFR